MLLSSCDSKKESGGMSAAAKKNLEVNEAIAKCFDTKDFSKIGDYLSEDFVDYAGQMGPVKGIEANKKEFERMMSMMDSSSSKIDRAFGDDEYVLSWMTFKGKLKSDMMGMKVGDWMDSKAIEVTQFKDGKAIAHWSYMDVAEMMKMMGGQNTMPMPDSTMKMGDK